MRIQVAGLLAILIIGLATADVKPLDKSSLESSSSLLSTLQKMHTSLNAQIFELEHMKTIENSEKVHLLQHYTAQKNNIEREIASIQSIEASHTEVAAPRHILKNLSAEEKTVSSLLNIFKKPNNSDKENDINGYSLPYSPYHPGYGQQYPYPYPYPYPHYGQPTKPDHPYPNDLIQDTFPGYEHNNHHNPTFLNREQHPQSYQTPPGKQVSLQVPQQYTPPSQIMLQPLVQPPQPDPQRTQPQLEPYGAQAVNQQQPQLEPFRPQPQLEPYRPEPVAQPQLEPFLTHQPTQNRPQLGSTPDLGAQSLQQSPYGQKLGVFVYYPNGIVDEEEQGRPTIADRFGQAFDRVGQVISNLANRPNLRSSQSRDSANAAKKKPEKSTERRRVTSNRPRSSTTNEKLKAKPMMETGKTTTTTDKPKMQWVSV